MRANYIGLAGNHRVHPEGQILQGNVAVPAIIGAVESFHSQPGQLKDGFADALAGNRTGVDANTAHHQGAVDHGYAFPQLGCGDGAFLARGPAADYDEIKVLGRS